MSEETIKGPASYFPAIEKKYGRPIADWKALVRAARPAKHMELVALLKDRHGMGHGHAMRSLRIPLPRTILED